MHGPCGKWLAVGTPCACSSQERGEPCASVAPWVTLHNPGFSAVEQSRGQANVVLRVSGVT